MEIRQALQTEEEAVCSLWRQLIDFYHKKVNPLVLQRSYHYTLHHPAQVRVYVAVLDGKIAGTASLHMGHYSTWNDNWYGHVEDVIVDPAYRRRGVADALVRHILFAAGELGLSRLELNALNENMSARKMYEKIGFTTDSVVYELPVKQKSEVRIKFNKQ